MQRAKNVGEWCCSIARINPVTIVNFFSGWCSWIIVLLDGSLFCWRDPFYRDKEIKPIFENHFVITKLVINENDKVAEAPEGV